MELIIVRHGRPERIEGIADGADPGLTEIGHAQAQLTAEVLLRQQIDHVVSSPMRRAQETARPLAQALGITPVLNDDLIEIDNGNADYRPMEEVKAEGGAEWQTILDDPTSIHEGADIEEFADRVKAAFDTIIAESRGKTVVAFCHGLVTMQFLRRLLGYENPYAIMIDYASINRVQASTSGPSRTVRSVNETAHLGDARIVSP